MPLCGPSCKLRLARFSAWLKLQDRPSVAIIHSLWPWPYVCLQYIWSRVGKSWVLRNINWVNNYYFQVSQVIKLTYIKKWFGTLSLGLLPIFHSYIGILHFMHFISVWSPELKLKIWERSNKWLLRYSNFDILRPSSIGGHFHFKNFVFLFGHLRICLKLKGDLTSGC